MDCFECWIRSVSCIYIKRRLRTLGSERRNTFIIVNINYILSSAYNDVVVPCNDLDVWEFGPLGLCVSLGRQWAPNYMYQLVLEPKSFGYYPL